MNKQLINTLSVSALALVFSAGALGFGGGGIGDDDGLPQPENCDSNCGFERGPDPSVSSVASNSGPFSISNIDVSRSVDGFNGGTIYYPTDTSGELAAVAVVPGFTASQSSISWWGPALASHGFIVITIDTNSRFDQPESRGRQLDSALSHLITEGENPNSPLFTRVAENRLASIGHSLGGGGALRSASRNRISAAIPLAPFDTLINPFSDIDVPTMIVACENDIVAPVALHASPFYDRISSNTDKVLLEIDNGGHSCANGNSGNNPLLSTYGVSWMKRFLDKDGRYNQFLCGPNHEANGSISDFKDTCSF